MRRMELEVSCEEQRGKDAKKVSVRVSIPARIPLALIALVAQLLLAAS